MKRLGPFKKYVILPGGRRVDQKDDKVGWGYEQKSDVTPLKKHCFNSHIRMNLKVVITPLHLVFSVALHIDNKFYAENVHILANKYNT